MVKETKVAIKAPSQFNGVGMWCWQESLDRPGPGVTAAAVVEVTHM